MKNVVLARIDDRLIHGQVMTSWLNVTGATRIIIVDDETAQDAFLKMIVTSVAPANVKTEVYTIEEAVTVFKGLAERSEKVIVLVKYPSVLVNLAEKGIVFAEINIGGMGAKEGRQKFYKNISASPEELQALSVLIAKGSDIFIQIIAEDKAIDVKKLIK
ncbi:PTS sugar transporter subunit IIB [Vagococcus sp. BWB3-3]|uniref:PTS sugar transporter subunit IIB n=1 Tax=Vagococcus allomyrinae TaxID=2794353 RepID=A0A940PC78_9ENTE|nr:PTS sugar transporter subunit IIB [Vagococcus allomyrinae]MBP1042294.1 PTS sugar transporter subunit IIB [Vagococcus allomyrinae]